MLSEVKKFARNTSWILKTHILLKKIVVYPLSLTPLGVLQLEKVPLSDLLNFKKIRLMMTVRPYTKNGYARLTNIYNLALDAERRNLPGAFVECGVWKGGLCAVMGAVAKEHGNRRKTWYMDSFEGMPKVAAPEDGSGTEEIAGDVLKASVSDVEEVVFGKLHLDRDKNIIVKGWFEESVPRVKAEIGPIAVLRLDADWYEATKLLMEQLYDQVVPGGYLVFDDYGRWVGSRKAVDEFLAARGIKPKMQFVGSTDSAIRSNGMAPMFFQKP